jgi:hypothetical protein
MRYNQEGDNAMFRITIIILMTATETIVMCAVGTTGALDIGYTFPLSPNV